jgi:DNA-binding response OmpR family regulator
VSRMGAPLVKTRWAVIVEEDEAFAERVSRALARLGFSVETTPSAQGSVDKVVELCPEVVVLGASLPGAAGICDDVKALDSVIRVILAGATTSHPEGNVDGYIDKKMDEDELAEVAATVLGTAREAGAPAATADAVERLRRQFAEARRAPRSGTAAEDVLDDRDGEIARLQAEVVDREQRILAIQGKRRRVVAELAEALRLSRKSRRDLEVLLDSAQTTLDAALREREDSERLHERENQEHIERFSLEEERRRELEAELAEHRGAVRRLSEERTALEAGHAQAISTHEEERRRVLRRSTDERAALEAASQTR